MKELLKAIGSSPQLPFMGPLSRENTNRLIEMYRKWKRMERAGERGEYDHLRWSRHQ